jgi:hypothetical protein
MSLQNKVKKILCYKSIQQKEPREDRISRRTKKNESKVSKLNVWNMKK